MCPKNGGLHESSQRTSVILFFFCSNVSYTETNGSTYLSTSFSLSLKLPPIPSYLPNSSLSSEASEFRFATEDLPL